jgi:hypothetical protein
MTSPPVLVVVRTRDPHRQAEALRAALGLTLRGSRVEVAIEEAIEEAIEKAIEEAGGDAMGAAIGGVNEDVNDALATPLARRAADTLRAFGHPVGALSGEALAAALARAGRVEVWT